MLIKTKNKKAILAVVKLGKKEKLMSYNKLKTNSNFVKKLNISLIIDFLNLI